MRDDIFLVCEHLWGNVSWVTIDEHERAGADIR